MGKRVLVVDDNRSLLDLSAEILRMAGHDVETCSDAAGALGLLTSRPFDVVVTDLDVGHGWDGYILAGATRILHADATVLLVTGTIDLEATWRAISSTADQVVVKPADPLELQKLVATVHAQAPVERPRLSLSEMIERYRGELVGIWLERVESDAMLTAIPLPREERLDDMEPLLDEIVHQLRQPEEPILAERARAAWRHGKNRSQHHYPVQALLREASHLRQSVTRLLTHHFLEIDPVDLLSDLFQLNIIIDENMAHSLDAFLGR